MAMSCHGKKDGMQCTAILYKCSKCGATGCKKDGCSNHTFEGERCKKCGNCMENRQA